MEFRITPGKEMSEGLFYKNGRALATFEINVEPIEASAPKRLALASQHCVAMNGALALRGNKKKLEIHKSTVVWTAITKNRKVVGFEMSYPGMYKKFKAFFGAEYSKKARLQKLKAWKRVKTITPELPIELKPIQPDLPKLKPVPELKVLPTGPVKVLPRYMVSTKVATDQRMIVDLSRLRAVRELKEHQAREACLVKVSTAGEMQTVVIRRRASSVSAPHSRTTSMRSHRVIAKVARRIRSNSLEPKTRTIKRARKLPNRSSLCSSTELSEEQFKLTQKERDEFIEKIRSFSAMRFTSGSGAL